MVNKAAVVADTAAVVADTAAVEQGCLSVHRNWNKRLNYPVN